MISRCEPLYGATGELPADALITVTVTYKNGRTAEFTARAGDADPFRVRVPGYGSVTVVAHHRGHLVGQASATR